jgi:excisionase family DNA binding protein
LSEMLSRSEAANYLGLDARTVYDRFRVGDIPAVRVGRVLRFERAHLDAWKKRQTINAPDADLDEFALSSEPRTVADA